MKTLFPGYYKKSEEQLQQVWPDSLIALDANVLLNLYRYSETTKLEFLKVLEELIDQIWVPHQAALEFQRNRLNVIADQFGRFSDVKNLIKTSKGKFNQEMAKRELEKKHSAINPENFLEKLDVLYSQFQAELEDLESRQLNVEDDDNVRDELDEILNGKVGEPPESQEWLDNLYKEGKIRYEYRCPPGFEDENKSSQNVDKSSGFFHNGLRYERKFGDLIFWKQLIEKASSEDIKKVILVTDDLKEDWWWTEGNKTIGPRPELTEEIMQKAKVETFLMYRSERFLYFASKYLDLEIPEKSIKQVRDVMELRSPELTTNHVDTYDLESEDIEYLDLLEIFEEGFATGTETLTSIASLIRDVGEKMRFHTTSINQLTEDNKKPAAKDAKKIINDAARDISNFADQLEERTTGFSELFEQSINAIPLAAVRIEDEEERNKQITELIPHLETLLNQFKYAIVANVSMRDSIANLPRATGYLNRAKRRGTSALDLFLNALNQIKQSIEEIISNLRGLI